MVWFYCTAVSIVGSKLLIRAILTASSSSLSLLVAMVAGSLVTAIVGSSKSKGVSDKRGLVMSKVSLTWPIRSVTAPDTSSMRFLGVEVDLDEGVPVPVLSGVPVWVINNERRKSVGAWFPRA